MVFNGARLKKARLYRNMTITELADRINISKQAISQFEKGAVAPKADVFFSIVLALGFPKNFLRKLMNIPWKLKILFFGRYPV